MPRQINSEVENQFVAAYAAGWLTAAGVDPASVDIQFWIGQYRKKGTFSLNNVGCSSQPPPLFVKTPVLFKRATWRDHDHCMSMNHMTQRWQLTDCLTGYHEDFGHSHLCMCERSSAAPVKTHRNEFYDTVFMHEEGTMYRARAALAHMRWLPFPSRTRRANFTWLGSPTRNSCVRAVAVPFDH